MRPLYRPISICVLDDSLWTLCTSSNGVASILLLQLKQLMMGLCGLISICVLDESHWIL
jgi:hypothetical protein